jgi:ankyrin repeat protein
LETAESLLDHGANINQQQLDGNTAIMIAARQKCFGGVILLSEFGADLDLQNKDGKVLAHFLEGSGIDYIIERNQNVRLRK